MKTFSKLVSEVSIEDMETVQQKRLKALHKPTVLENPQSFKIEPTLAIKDHSRDKDKLENSGDPIEDNSMEDEYSDEWYEKIDDNLAQIINSWDSLYNTALGDDYLQNILQLTVELVTLLSSPAEIQPMDQVAGTYTDNTNGPNWGDDTIAEAFVKGKIKHKNGEETELSEKDARLLNKLKDQLSKESSPTFHHNVNKSPKSLSEVLAFAAGIL